jgi:hypothetical protein
MTKKILYSFLALIILLWIIWVGFILVNIGITYINASSNMSVFFGLNTCLLTVLLTIWVSLILKDFIKQNILN